MIGDATAPRGAAAATGLGRVDAAPRCAGLGLAACRCGAVMRTGGSSCGVDGGAACASAELGISIADAIPTVVRLQAAFETPYTLLRPTDPAALMPIAIFPMIVIPRNGTTRRALAPSGYYLSECDGAIGPACRMPLFIELLFWRGRTDDAPAYRRRFRSIVDFAFHFLFDPRRRAIDIVTSRALRRCERTDGAPPEHR